MLDKFIQKELSATLFDAFKKYAKKYNVPVENIRVFFSLDENGRNLYSVYKSEDNKMFKLEEPGFKELCGLKLDILKKEQKVPPIIALALMGMGDEMGMEPMAARMMMRAEGEMCENLGLYLFDGNTYKKPVTIEEIIEVISNLEIPEE